jgi:hypothetical protein
LNGPRADGGLPDVAAAPLCLALSLALALGLTLLSWRGWRTPLSEREGAGHHDRASGQSESGSSHLHSVTHIGLIVAM